MILLPALLARFTCAFQLGSTQACAAATAPRPWLAGASVSSLVCCRSSPGRYNNSIRRLDLRGNAFGNDGGLLLLPLPLLPLLPLLLCIPGCSHMPASGGGG